MAGWRGVGTARGAAIEPEDAGHIQRRLATPHSTRAHGGGASRNPRAHDRRRRHGESRRIQVVARAEPAVIPHHDGAVTVVSPPDVTLAPGGGTPGSRCPDAPGHG